MDGGAGRRRGRDRITAPLTTRHEYEPFAAGVGDVGDLVRHYTAGLAGAPVHVQGHPPGPVVVAWLLDRAGLGGAGWLAAVALAGWGVAVAATVAAAAIVAGDDAARRAAPALAVLPAAVWAGTSLDARQDGAGRAGAWPTDGRRGARPRPGPRVDPIPDRGFRPRAQHPALAVVARRPRR